MPENLTPDFVEVRLTAVAQSAAKGHPVTFNGGRRSLTFIGDTPTRVEKSYEWRELLSKHFDAEGLATFELVPDTAAPIPALIEAEHAA
jgi:hypothetical protein